MKRMLFAAAMVAIAASSSSAGNPCGDQKQLCTSIASARYVVAVGDCGLLRDQARHECNRGYAENLEACQDARACPNEAGRTQRACLTDAGASVSRCPIDANAARTGSVRECTARFRECRAQ